VRGAAHNVDDEGLRVYGVLRCPAERHRSEPRDFLPYRIGPASPNGKGGAVRSWGDSV
jgi:hypothetical protein